MCVAPVPELHKRQHVAALSHPAAISRRVFGGADGLQEHSSRCWAWRAWSEREESPGARIVLGKNLLENRKLSSRISRSLQSNPAFKGLDGSRRVNAPESRRGLGSSGVVVPGIGLAQQRHGHWPCPSLSALHRPGGANLVRATLTVCLDLPTRRGSQRCAESRGIIAGHRERRGAGEHGAALQPRRPPCCPSPAVLPRLPPGLFAGERHGAGSSASPLPAPLPSLCLPAGLCPRATLPLRGHPPQQTSTQSAWLTPGQFPIVKFPPAVL